MLWTARSILQIFRFDLLWQDCNISKEKWCLEHFTLIQCTAANWWAGIICWSRLSSDSFSKSSTVWPWRLLCHSQLSHSKWQKQYYYSAEPLLSVFITHNGGNRGMGRKFSSIC